MPHNLLDYPLGHHSRVLDASYVDLEVVRDKILSNFDR